MASSRAEKMQRQEALSLLGKQAYKEAEPYLRDALEQTREQSNSETFMWMQRLSLCLCRQDKCVEAEKFAQEAISGFKRFGPDDEDMLDCKYLQVECLHGQRKYTAAEDLARETLKALEDNVMTRRGPDHPVAFKCRGLLALILKAQGKTRESAPLARQNLEAMEVVTKKAEAMETAGSRRLSWEERNAFKLAKSFCEKALGLDQEEEDKENARELNKPKHTATIETVSTEDPGDASRLQSKQSTVA